MEGIGYPPPQIPTDPNDPDGSRLVSKILKIFLSFLLLGALFGFLFSKGNPLVTFGVATTSAVAFTFSFFMLDLSFKGIVLRKTIAASRVSLPHPVEGLPAIFFGLMYLLYAMGACAFAVAIIGALLNH